jgi:hypothetical protein
MPSSKQRYMLLWYLPLSVTLQLFFVRAQLLSPGCLCWAQDVQGISNCRLIILSWKGNCKVSFKYLIVRHGKNTFPKGKGYRMMVCQKLVQYVDVGSLELKFQTQWTCMNSWGRLFPQVFTERNKALYYSLSSPKLCGVAASFLQFLPCQSAGTLHWYIGYSSVAPSWPDVCTRSCRCSHKFEVYMPK